MSNMIPLETTGSPISCIQTVPSLGHRPTRSLITRNSYEAGIQAFDTADTYFNGCSLPSSPCKITSLLYREEECEMFPTLKIFGVISNPGSPLVRGALTRPLGQQTDRGQTDSVKELAKKKGITMAQVALAWILTKDGEWFFTFMYVLDPSNPPPKVSAPIVGATNYKISLLEST
ncbi:hypothetical protein BDR04DRAFT_1164371 [Suillus decipiens]|nr:hypothetical protein BDR04DRAFT_1164371 [Suillus decipiens]